MNLLLGQGRWRVEVAIEEAVAADMITAALFTRSRSRREHTFGETMLSAAWRRSPTALAAVFSGSIGFCPMTLPPKPKRTLVMG
jgi:hypothetical protein